MKSTTLVILLTLLIWSCQNNPKTSKSYTVEKSNTVLFSKVSPEKSKVNFQNNIYQKTGFSFINYDYVYMGGGVAVIDYNNDGLKDLYFVSSFESNKLYKNLGNLVFEDVTSTSKTEDNEGFSTGATVFDVNNDGYEDIYVSKAGSLENKEMRKNKLFVNQKDGSFKEEAAAYGLDHEGFTTQSYPFDFDRDGDLDLFILNHRDDFDKVDFLNTDFQNNIIFETSDHLFRNDNGTFTRITHQTNVGSKSWGLSAITSDLNNDNWSDLFVCNDFFQPDYYYLNNQQNNFINVTNNNLKHLSQSSMGSDAADLNNDLLTDIITVDMMSNDHKRSKENMASMSTENFRSLVNFGYHYQYASNMLHLNKGYGFFTETGLLSGIAKTDWSWSVLMADFDNDGLKDVFITNGVEREYNNQDTRKKLDSISALGKTVILEDILALYPSEPLINNIFQNQGNLHFQPKMEDWGVQDKTFSNGVVYVDLDNDGDLEIVTNNIGDYASIYKNNATNNFITFKLQGDTLNTAAWGTKVYVETKLGTQMLELYPTRGYLSSVTPMLHFGLGSDNEINKAVVVWPNGETTRLNNLTVNTVVAVDFKKAQKATTPYTPQATFNKKAINPSTIGIDFVQQENNFDDYTLQLLLHQKQSTKGTKIAVGDVNGDQKDDVYVGNALGAASALYIQEPNGTFKSTNTLLWKQEAKYEDGDAVFFDSDNDGDLDLYVVSSGYELKNNDPLLQDRLYINDGMGNFSKSKGQLPQFLANGKSVSIADIDNDQDLDLFIGGNVLPRQYPLASQSYLLRNDNGTFTNITHQNEALNQLGIVSSSRFTDYDGDNDPDLLIVGEWMTPTLFKNEESNFVRTEIEAFQDKEGWWFDVIAKDFDNDGDTDYVLGNLGGNNKFHPSKEKPLFINAKDFDNNGSFDVALSKIHNGKIVPIRGKECSSEQNPFLLDKIKTYKEFANLDMESIYGEEAIQEAHALKVTTFKTVYVENLGDGKFKTKELPNIAQLGPSLSFTVSDFNNDGNYDILGVGAIYDVEVETIRYDSNFGYVLLGDGAGNFKEAKELDPFVVSDAKDVKKININGQEHYMVLSNNAPLHIFNYY